MTKKRECSNAELNWHFIWCASIECIYFSIISKNIKNTSRKYKFVRCSLFTNFHQYSCLHTIVKVPLIVGKVIHLDDLMNSQSFVCSFPFLVYR